jgi:hypothetical protein
MKRLLHLQWWPILLLFFFQNISYGQGWSQFGPSINGVSPGDNAGTALSLSADGKIVAVGSFAALNFAGEVRLFERSGSNWVQKGSGIYGANHGDGFGRAVSVDSTGTVVAIGAPYNDAGFGSSSMAGEVRIFQWSGSAWTQKGATLQADAAGDNFGYSVNISTDGNTVAIGAPFNNAGGTGRGAVKIFRWNSSAWVQLGANINGEGNNDISGNAVSLSGNGNTVAIGAPFNSAGALQQSGQTRVYTWNGTTWTQQGIDIDGTATNDYSGQSVSLSNDGKTLAVGAPQDFFGGGFGWTKVYTWNSTAWVQKGSTVTSPIMGDAFGATAIISKDGNYLTAGASMTVTGNETGRALVYNWVGSNWQLKGDTIKGASNDAKFGEALGLSYNGQYVAIGAPGQNGSGPFSGQAKVYTYSNCIPNFSTVPVSVCGTQYTSPSGRYTWTTNGMNYKDTIPNAGGCDSVITIQLSLNSYPVVNLGSDKTLCVDSLLLDAGNAGAGYVWNNNAVSQTIYANTTGTYFVKVTQNGCATSDTIVLNIKKPSSSVISPIACGTQYTSPSGKIWTISGNYKDTLPNAVGCDSIITVHLTIQPIPVVNFGTLDTTGRCGDNIILDAGNAGASFQWYPDTTITTQSIVVDSTGIYAVKVIKNGCLVTGFISVTIKKPSASTQTIVLCANQYVSPSGKIWNTSNTYVDTIPNAKGCDSIITIHLTINPKPIVSLGRDTTLCADSFLLDARNAGASYVWNNNAVSQTIYANAAGSYFVKVTKNGCTTSDTIVLNIKKPSSSIISPIVCGDQYTSPSGKIWTTGNTYSDTIPNAIGCDSIITVHLTINPVPVVNFGTADTTGRCGDNTILLDAGNADASFKWLPDTTVTTQTLLVDTTGWYGVQVTKNGCSAVGAIHVTIRKPSTSNQTITICGDKYISPSGKHWTTSDTYSDTIPNASGCDSTMTIHLTLKPTVMVNLGNDIAAPCKDSMMILNAGNEGTGASYLWNNDNNSTNQTFTAKTTGTYFVKVSMPNGCTVSDTIKITIANLSMQTSISGLVFSVKDSGATSYTWLDCTKNMQPIPGANSQSYTARGCVGDSINYAVVVNKNGCIDTSDHIPFLIPFIQIGGVIDLTTSVQSIDLSADESTMAVGTLFNGVRMYKRKNTLWELKSIIAKDGYWNQSVSLSADGNTVIIGWFKPGIDPAAAIVYHWDGTNWMEKGDGFNGASGSYMPVAISADGNTIAFGDPSNWPNGLANVYKWDQSTSSWMLKGSTIGGEYRFGTAVALSDDGNTIAVTSTYNNSYTGQVKVYQWKASSSNWEQRGTDINGASKNDYWGYTVALSADGNTLISGGNDIGKDSVSYVKAFLYNGTDWKQKGSVIPLFSSNISSKVIVSLSADGNRILASSDGTINSNIAKKIKWDGRDWAQIGSNITTLHSIYCLAIAAAGNSIVLGSGFYTTEYEECTGELPPVGIAEVINSTKSNKGAAISLYPNPSTGSFTVKTDNGKYIDKVEVYNIMGQVVYGSSFDNKTSETNINLNQNKTGIYFIKVTSEGQQTTARLLLQP